MTVLSNSLRYEKPFVVWRRKSQRYHIYCVWYMGTVVVVLLQCSSIVQSPLSCRFRCHVKDVWLNRALLLVIIIWKIVWLCGELPKELVCTSVPNA